MLLAILGDKMNCRVAYVIDWCAIPAALWLAAKANCRKRNSNKKEFTKPYWTFHFITLYRAALKGSSQVL